MVELQQIIERVKAATGPDRELDRDIASFFGDYVKCEPRNRTWRSAASRQGPFRALPNVTASIDAALALTERVLPGWQIAMGTVGEDDIPWACVTEPVDPCRYYAASSTEIPLALVEATLSALSSVRQKP